METVYLSKEELKIINKAHRSAYMTKCSLSAIISAVISFIIWGICDFLRTTNNAFRSSDTMYYSIILVLIFLFVMAINCIRLRYIILKNETWKQMIDKLSGGKTLNNFVEAYETAAKKGRTFYMFGDLLTMSKELKEFGKAIRDIAGIYVLIQLIRECSLIIEFTSKIKQTKKFNKNVKFLFFIPAIIIIIIELFNTISYIKNSEKSANEEKNKIQKIADVDSVTLNQDYRIVRLTDGGRIKYSVDYNENKKIYISSISISKNYSVDSSKEEILQDFNDTLKLSYDVIRRTEFNCAYEKMCKEHSIPDEFKVKFENIDNKDITSETPYELRHYEEYISHNANNLHEYEFYFSGPDTIDNNIHICFEVH